MLALRRRSQFLKATSGFTLIELLVVIAIIATLIALLLPAVQQAREAARRSQCVNNLKQISLAFHNYADVWGGFPNRHAVYGTSLGTGHGWPVKMLPYVEQAPLYNQFDINKSFYDTENKAVTTTPVSVYMCPTAPSNPRIMDLSSATTTTSIGYAGDYVVFHLFGTTGTGVTCSNCSTVAPQATGGLTRLRDITDGMSSSMLISEQAGRPDYYIGRTQQPTNSGLVNPKFWGGWASYQSVTGQSWNANSPPSTPGAGGVYAMNRCNSQGIYSFHIGGANIGLADGSVRFVSENIHIPTLIALWTRNGNETIGEY